MKPSGVQLASAIVPPGRQTRSSSAAVCCVVGREHRAEDRRDGVEGAVGERQRLGVALDELDVEALGGGAPAAALEQGRHVVDADGVAAEPRRGDRGVAAAGGDVEHAPAGVQVGGVAELLGDEHDPGGDDGEVAARPGLLLAPLDVVEVGLACLEGGCHDASLCGRWAGLAGSGCDHGTQGPGPASSAADTHLRRPLST